MKNISNFSKCCVFDVYCELKEIVSLEYIEEREVINKKLLNIECYKIAIPSETYSKIEDFIEINIIPIFADDNYFNNFEPRWGDFNDGVFEFNSDKSLAEFLSIFLEKVEILNKKLDDFAFSELQPYLI